ncbi:MAG TPA: hypothetical protein VLV56_15315 [Burkholderiales bacterium]|nr:hypothetical protein [Burkholderiales bacterium]
MKTRTKYLMTALLLAFGAIESSSAGSQGNLSDALEQALPSLAHAQDYWSASKISLQLANERNRLNEGPAACQALAESLDYYRMALAKETNTPLSAFGTGLGDDEGMRDIRARFGCPSATA